MALDEGSQAAPVHGAGSREQGKDTTPGHPASMEQREAVEESPAMESEQVGPTQQLLPEPHNGPWSGASNTAKMSSETGTTKCPLESLFRGSLVTFTDHFWWSGREETIWHGVKLKMEGEEMSVITNFKKLGCEVGRVTAIGGSGTEG